MAYSTSVGSSFYISQTFASAKTITAASNANPAVLTSVAHGYSDGDEVLFSSGWELANNTVFKVDQLTADTFELEGLNSTSTDNYAVGSGVGETFKISSWLELPQVIGVSASGGNPRFIDVRPIKLMQGLKLPDGFESSTITFDIGFDPSLSNWDTFMDISRNNTLVAYKYARGTRKTYGYGYLSIAEQPQLSSGAVDKVQATFTAQGRLISYAT